MLLLAPMCGLNAVGQHQTAQSRKTQRDQHLWLWHIVCGTELSTKICDSAQYRTCRYRFWISVPCSCQSLRTVVNLSLRWFNPPPLVHQLSHSGLHKSPPPVSRLWGKSERACFARLLPTMNCSLLGPKHQNLITSNSPVLFSLSLLVEIDLP